MNIEIDNGRVQLLDPLRRDMEQFRDMQDMLQRVIFNHFSTISVFFVDKLRYHLIHNSFIYFSLSGSVWERFKGVLAGPWRDRLIFTRADDSSTS
jgi:hypothetical protein